MTLCDNTKISLREAESQHCGYSPVALTELYVMYCCLFHLTEFILSHNSSCMDK